MPFPVVIPMIATMLVTLVGTIVGRVMVSLGMAVVYYRGITVALDWAQDLFFSNLATMPALALQVAGVLQIGTCVKVIFTTFGIRASLLGLTSDGFKRWVMQ